MSCLFQIRADSPLYIGTIGKLKICIVMGAGKGRLLGAHAWDIRITDITKAFLQVSGKQSLNGEEFLR
jgi:hypothetical protein